MVLADTPSKMPISAADSPSRCLCALSHLAEYRMLLFVWRVSRAVAVLPALTDDCFSRVATRRFNAAMSDRYCADAFFSFAVSLRSSLRASRVISAFRAVAMFDNFVPFGGFRESG